MTLQSRLVCGWKKLAAKAMKITESITTRNHSPPPKSSPPIVRHLLSCIFPTLARQARQVLVATAPGAEEEPFAIALHTDRALTLDGHPADRVGRHGDHVLEVTVLQPQHPIGDVPDTLVVAHDDDASALLLGDGSQQAHDLVPDLRVQVRGRLVGEDEGWVVDEGPADGDPLLLTARKLLRQEVEPRSQIQLREDRLGLAAGDAPRRAGQFGHDGDVLEDRQRREQVEVLEDEAEAPQSDVGKTTLRQGADLGTVEQDRTLARSEQRTHHREE